MFSRQYFRYEEIYQTVQWPLPAGHKGFCVQVRGLLYHPLSSQLFYPDDTLSLV